MNSTCEGGERPGTSAQAATAPAVAACLVEEEAGAGRPATADPYPDPGHHHTVAGAQAVAQTRMLAEAATSAAAVSCLLELPPRLLLLLLMHPLAADTYFASNHTHGARLSLSASLHPAPEAAVVAPPTQALPHASIHHIARPAALTPSPLSPAPSPAGTSAAVALHPSGAATAGHPADRQGAATPAAAAATAAAGRRGGPPPSLWCPCPGPARRRLWPSRSARASCRAGSLG